MPAYDGRNILAIVQKSSYLFAKRRVDKMRRDVVQRNKYELALMQPRMRDGEEWRIRLDASKEKQVKVYRSRLLERLVGAPQ
jgi:hypothetical protein